MVVINFRLSKLHYMEDYDIIRQIGAGSFGTVHLAENKETGQKVVVKEKRSDILAQVGLFVGILRLLLISTLKKRIPVLGLNEARREKVFEEFRLLSCLRDISIVR